MVVVVIEGVKVETQKESKGILGLRKHLARRKKDLENADPDTRWFYEHQVRQAEYDLEDALSSERKKIIRRNFKRLAKLVEQIEELRKETSEMINPSGYGNDYDDAREVQKELENKYGFHEFRRILWGER